MCTLTWLLKGDGYDLVFSRDEARTRPEAESPFKWDADSGSSFLSSFLAPRDPEAGGTWIAVNKQGVSLCLLNDYSNQRPLDEAGEKRSRGLLVRDLTALGSVEKILQALDREDLSRYQAFRLVVFCPFRFPSVHHWDGIQLTHFMTPEAPVTSSSWNTEEVLAHRAKVYREFQQHHGSGTVEDLLAFHRLNSPAPYAPAMSREKSWTVSITHVRVRAERTTMRYWAGHPDTHGEREALEQEIFCDFGVPEAMRHPMRYSAKTIDLGRVIETRAPKIAKWIPNSIFQAMERVLGIDGLNRRLQRLGTVSPIAFPERGMESMGVRIVVHSAKSEADPDEGEVAPLIVANHSTGGPDGLGLLAYLLRWYGDAHALANELLSELPSMDPFMTRIGGKHGKARELALAVQKIFKSGRPTLIFPAGETARDKGGLFKKSVLVEGQWQKTFVSLALKYGRSVIPAYITGRNSRFFYGLSRWRKRLGMSFNPEQFFLLRETLYPQQDEIHFHMGALIKPEELRALGRDDQERSQAVRERVMVLQKAHTENACAKDAHGER